MNHTEIALQLAAHIRELVHPLIGKMESRRVTGTAASGDATFSIDNVAEDAVVDFIQTNKLNVAYYTEDAGLRNFGEPEAILIIDPIDGTRGAISGFECCVVSVAVADYNPDPRLRDVRAGCIHEIKQDRVFLAERGAGAKIYESGKETQISTSKIKMIKYASWSSEFVGRPAAIMARVLGEAIDTSSVTGGFFIFNSSAFSLTRLITGQLSAVVDIAARVIEDIPETREAFLKAGNGAIIGLFPHDIAAAYLIAKEAGCHITDAYGNCMDDLELIPTSKDCIYSIIAASNATLHKQFLSSVNEGMETSARLTP